MAEMRERVMIVSGFVVMVIVSHSTVLSENVDFLSCGETMT
jgi:hypothetical protein